MRVGILAHSFSAAFKIHEAIDSIPGLEVFIVLSPSPNRSPWSANLANLVRFGVITLKSFDLKSIRLLLEGRLILLSESFDGVQSLHKLRRLDLDIGLHKAGVIYREVTIQAFRLGILNAHIGILPAYRGRSVMEWSMLQGDPVGITVFLIDSGIDTGSRILISEEVNISNCKSVSEAKRYLFSLDASFFRRALALLHSGRVSFQLNDGSGRRYFVMSKLFQSVVQQLMLRRPFS